MVQIIPEFRRPSLSDQFGEAFAGIGKSLSEDIPQELMGKAERRQLGSLIGKDINDIRNPDFLKLLLSSHLSQQESAAKRSGDIESAEQSTEVINKFFGPDAAELWPHLTEGGRTELFKELLLGKRQGMEVNDVLTHYFQNNPEEVQNIQESLSSEEGITSPVQKREPRGLSGKAEEEITKKEIEASEKYLGELREKYHRARTLEPVFEELKDTVNAGGTDALSAGNLADIGQKMGGFLGTTFNAIGKALESGETGKFRALSKKLLDEMKDIFGGQIRVKELEVFLSMLPEIGKSKEANLASIDVLQRLSTASTMFYDTAQEIIQKNGGKIPRNLADQVQKQLKPVLSDLAKDITKTTTKFQKENKKLTKDIASQILKEAKGDKELARKIAKQRGYKF